MLKKTRSRRVWKTTKTYTARLTAVVTRGRKFMIEVFSFESLSKLIQMCYSINLRSPRIIFIVIKQRDTFS